MAERVATDETHDRGYDPVRFRMSAANLSWMCLLGLMTFLAMVRLLARITGTYYFWSVSVVVLVPLLSLLGILFALVSFRRGERRASSGIALAFHSAVFLSFLVANVLTRL